MAIHDQLEMNVVFPDVSSSQWILPVLAALLLAMAALHWMNHLWLNHQSRPVARQQLLLPLVGRVFTADLLLRSLTAMAVRAPARAPPTSPSPSNSKHRDHRNPRAPLMAEYVDDLLTFFR